MKIRSALDGRALLAGVALACACGAAAAAPDAEASGAAYCKRTGGQAAVVHPYANTNADASQWMRYGGANVMCTYTSDDGSSIQIFGPTLKSGLPTMATLAYYAKVPFDGGFGNPSEAYCLQLGGTATIGSNGAGSMWTTAPGVLVGNMCVFADGSGIDTWGLFYHSADIVRGKDLATVLRFPNPY